MAASENKQPFSRLGIFFAGTALLLIIFFFGLHWFLVRTPGVAVTRGLEQAREIARDLASALPLQPTVRERTILVFEPPAEKADWLAVEQTFLVRHEIEDKFLGSVKRFDVEAVARVGMGFSFSGEWNMRLDSAAGAAFLDPPEPSVLFVEISGVQIRRDEDGWWNRIRPEDRQEALNSIEEKARSEFDRDALAEKARQSLLRTFNDILEPHGFTAGFEPLPPATNF